MLQVADVVTSSRWYQTVLGLESAHGGDEFEMLTSDDELVLQLHRLDAHEHHFATPDPTAAPGAGVSLWFLVPDLDALHAALARSRGLGAEPADPRWNPLAHHHEADMTDPDGYTIVVNTPFDPAGP